MTKSRIVACLALALSMQMSAVAAAQDMSFDLEETESSKPSKPKKGSKKGEKEKPPAAAPAEESTSEPGTDDEIPGQEPGAAGGGLSGEGAGTIGDLAADDGPAEKTDDAGPKPTEVSEEIYAVQRTYALRRNRIELMPSFGSTLNDPFVTHAFIGAGLNYWITNVLAIGANLNWYQGLEKESELNFHVRRSTRLGTRPTEYQFGASLNMTYVPVYGKFSMFKRYIFQWDAYLMGGIGVMQTRPVPVVDPQIRSFDYSFKLAILNPAIGIRVFLTKWFTIFGELRAYPYLEKLENLNVALGENPRQQKKGWLDDSPTIVTNVVASLGLSVYLPFGFDYKLPK